MTEVNVPVLQQTLEYIEAHPEKWLQSSWATQMGCGTAYCLAGTVVVQAGHKLQWQPAGWASRLSTGEPIETTAAAILGLSSADAWRLFAPWNSLDDLWRIAGELTDGAISRGEAS